MASYQSNATDLWTYLMSMITENYVEKQTCINFNTV